MAAGAFEFPLCRKQIVKCHYIKGAANVSQLTDGFENQTVFITVKVVFPYQIRNPDPRTVVQDQPTNYRLFSFD
ncbi:hypothetical protein TOC8171_48030 [Pseudomonas syringae]